MDNLKKIKTIANTLSLSIDKEILPLTQQQQTPIDLSVDCFLFRGNNLNGLSTLLSQYNNNIDLCYIDPPYNCTKKNIYQDHRKSKNHPLWGSHATWLAFMLPRLWLARSTLRPHGVIAISIDEQEYAYLKIVMDHIFGERNLLGNIVVCRSKNGRKSCKNIVIKHEYLLVYGKTSQAVLPDIFDKTPLNNNYNKTDELGQYKLNGLFRKKGAHSLATDRPNLFYPVYINTQGAVFLTPARGLKKIIPVDPSGIKRRWLWCKETAQKRLWQLYASKKGVIYIKQYKTPYTKLKTHSLWDDDRYLTCQATNEIKKIYGDKFFDTPKPLNFIIDILKHMTHSNAVILDFFAGSGTTAEAAHKLNSQDKGQRKVILMECNALIPLTHCASKTHKVISDLTLTRLNYIKKNDPNYCFNSINEV